MVSLSPNGRGALPATSLHSPDGGDRFRDWLAVEMDQRRLSQTRLAADLGVARTTVHRWLLPAKHPNACVPNYSHCQGVAGYFGVSAEAVYDLLGVAITPDPATLTAVQRDIIALVPGLPDVLLIPVRAMLRAWLTPATAADLSDQMREAMRGPASHD